MAQRKDVPFDIRERTFLLGSIINNLGKSGE